MNAITGTFSVAENRDAMVVNTNTLGEAYLLALMKRDAKIWQARYLAGECEGDGEIIRHDNRLDSSFVQKREPSKKESKAAAKAKAQAADEKRISQFGTERHPFVAAFRSSGIPKLKPTPKPKPAPRPVKMAVGRPAAPSPRAIAFAAGKELSMSALRPRA
jgi:hypothetical protein